LERFPHSAIVSRLILVYQSYKKPLSFLAE
jgi:hypothetical protein